MVAGCAPRQLPAAKALSGQTTLVGCLAAGPLPGEYVLTHREGNATTAVAGSPALENHVGHAVRITGSVDRELPRPGVKPIRVEAIAVTCRTPF